jgi:hypothetical protein
MLMMQYGQDANSHNLSSRLDRSRQRRIFLEPGTCLVEANNIPGADLPQMPGADDRHLIEMLAP